MKKKTFYCNNTKEVDEVTPETKRPNWAIDFDGASHEKIKEAHHLLNRGVKVRKVALFLGTTIDKIRRI
jgi:hypothetical protein